MSTLSPFGMKRLMRELTLLHESAEQHYPHQIKIIPGRIQNKVNPMYVKIIFPETDDTYPNLEMVFSIKYPNDYPLSPPELKAVTKNPRFHIGSICTTATRYHQTEWSASWSLEGWILATVSIMKDPDEKGIGYNKGIQKFTVQDARQSKDAVQTWTTQNQCIFDL